MSDLRAKLTLTLDNQMSRAAKAALGDLKTGSEAAVKGVHGLGVELDKLGASGRDSKGRFLPKGIGDEAEKAKTPVYGLGNALAGLMKQKTDPGAVLKGAGTEAFKAAPKVRTLSGAFEDFHRKIEAGHKRLFAMREAAGALDDAAQTIGGASNKIIGGLSSAGQSAIDFNAQFTDIGVKAGMKGEELETLRQKTMALGAEFGVLPGEVAKGIDVLSAAGWSGEKFGGEGLRDMMVAAKLGFSDFNTTAAVGTGIISVYGDRSKTMMQQTDDNRVMMLQLANAVNASKISMEDLNYGLQDNMVVAKKAGMELTDLLTIQGLFGDKNIKGGVANTATKNLAMLLGNPSKEAQKELSKLFGSQKKAKLALFDENGIRRQVPEVLANVKEQLDKAGGKWSEGTMKRENLMQALFGKDAAGYGADLMGALTEAATDSSGKALVDSQGKVITKYQEMKTKIEDTSKAQENLNALTSSSSAEIAKTGASWENLKITLGDQFLPAALAVATELGSILKTVKEWATEHPMLTKVVLYSALGLAAFGKTIGGTMSLISGGIKLYTAYTTATAGVGLAANASKLSIAGMATGLKAFGVFLLTTPWGWALMGIAVAGMLAYQHWDKVKGVMEDIGEIGASGPIADAMRGKEEMWEKVRIGKAVSDGKMTKERAEEKLREVEGRWKMRQLSAIDAEQNPKGLNDELASMTQQLQAGMGQMQLPPEVLALLQQQAAADKVSVTVSDERTIVKKGGAEVPFAQRVPT